MSFNSPKLDFTVEASVDLSANQFFALRLVALGAEVAASANADTVGILQNNPDSVGQASVVQNKGVAQAQVTVTSAIIRGTRLSVAADGTLTDGGTNDVATALEPASGTGSIIAVLLD